MGGRGRVVYSFRFPRIFDLFKGLKIRIPSGRLGETSTFKIMTDDVTLWSKLEATSTRFYNVIS